jgi:serine/threonine protein kinase
MFVALKTPRPDLPDQSRAIARLRREYSHAQNLSHASIVQVFDLDCDGDVWFMTMEMLDGASLAAILRRIVAPLPPHVTRRVLQSTAEALAYSHWFGVAHGDFNPANVFVTKQDRVKVLDFGAACGPDQAASAAATPAYASPQVLAGATPSIRDDVFSFGCIAYECLVGKHPFQQRPSNVAQAEGQGLELPAEIPTEQAEALRAALAWDSESRPDDIKMLARTLAPPTVRQRQHLVIESEDELAPPPAADDKRWWIFGGLCLAAMIVAVIATRLG